MRCDIIHQLLTSYWNTLACSPGFAFMLGYWVNIFQYSGNNL